MSHLSSTEYQRIRFEEVAPTNTVVAFLAVKLLTLAARFKLSVFEGYDDLDSLQFAFLPLPSGQIVTLGEYANSPQAGVDLFIDLSPLGIPESDIPTVVFEALQVLDIDESQVTWLHPDFEVEIKQKYTNPGSSQAIPSLVSEPTLVTDPVECLKFALTIYTQTDFPNYWAMLQHNLGLAYYHRWSGNRQENLEAAIARFHRSQEVYTAEKFPEKWLLNQEDLQVAQQALEEFRNLIRDIREKRIENRQLAGMNLNGATLREADLSEADLNRANLWEADLSGANVANCRFGEGIGLSDTEKSALKARGAIFSDAQGDWSVVGSRTPSPTPARR